MIGHKINAKKFNVFSQAGAAMIEFAFVIPIMSLLAVTGYNIMKDFELTILKRDFARSLSQSYRCSFEQKPTCDPSGTGYEACMNADPVKICYKEIVSELSKYAQSKDVLGSTNTDGIKDFQYSINTYALVDPTSLTSTRKTCPSSDAAISQLKIDHVGGYTSNGFEAKAHYTEEKVQGRAGAGMPMRVSDLYRVDYLTEEARKQARLVICENAQITITELNFVSKPLLNFSLSDASIRDYYEFSFQ